MKFNLQGAKNDVWKGSLLSQIFIILQKTSAKITKVTLKST